MIRTRSFRRLTNIAVAALAAAGTLGACGSDSAAPAGPVIEIELGRYVITPADLSVPAGNLSLRVTNTDVMAHNLVVAGYGTRNLGPGESQTLAVKIAAGDYRMWCDIPGHASLGQTGTLHSA